jgi:2-keto-4-pentenoate hydratase
MTDTSRTAAAIDRDGAAAVARLEAAARTGTPCPPVRDLLGATDLDRAYAVQQELGRLRTSRGARVVGRKIGLTAPAVQRQLGVDQPDFGVLYDDMACGPTVAIERLLQPRIEAEVAFVLAEDLAEGPFDAPRIAAAVDYAVAALEIVDSRIAGWDISIVDTIADNASSGLFVLGGEQVGLAGYTPVDSIMVMTINGEVVSEGTGAACLGDPLAAVAWLARTAAERGDPLLKGQVVLSGALGPMVPVVAGDEVAATISGLGTVSTRFVRSEE